MAQEAAAAQATVARHPLDQPCHDRLSSIQFWNRMARDSIKAMSRPMLSADWMQAVHQGPAAIASWLTRSARPQLPRLRTTTDAQAQAVVTFRAEVCQLDARCSVDKEDARNQQAQATFNLLFGDPRLACFGGGNPILSLLLRFWDPRDACFEGGNPSLSQFLRL